MYFASDRGGSFNLWRVIFDETTGERLGEPEPVTTPASCAGYLSVARDGRRIAYASLEPRGNIFRIGLDPEAGAVVGPSSPVTRGSLCLTAPAVSPDGDFLAAQSVIV